MINGFLLLQHDSCLNSFDEKVQSLNKDVSIQKSMTHRLWVIYHCRITGLRSGPYITEILSVWIPVLIQAITQLLFAMVQRSDEIVHPIGQISLQYFPVTNFHWLSWFQTKTMSRLINRLNSEEPIFLLWKFFLNQTEILIQWIIMNLML